MAKENQVFGFGVTLLTIPAGFSNALLVLPAAGEVSSGLKYFTGGSIEIMQAQVGITTPVQTAAGQGYLMGTNEAISTVGSARYYLCATGSTAQAYLLRGLGAGF